MALPSDNPETLRAQLLRAYFAIVAAAAGLAGLTLVLRPDVIGPQLAWPLVLANAMVCVGCLAALRLPPMHTERGLTVITLASLAILAASAWHSGRGLAAPGQACVGLLTCLSCALSNRRRGLTVVVAAALTIAVLASGQALDLLPLRDAVAAEAPLLRLATQLIVLGLGAAAGLALSRMLNAYLADAAERERRFRGLLGIATAAYWETDAKLRLQHVSLRDDSGRFVALPLPVPRPIWELPRLRLGDEVVDAMRADMECREPLRDLALSAPDQRGRRRHYLASGEPRFDAQGVFVGYWGVARDVTEAHQARQALRATETRYQELFRRIPTPLVVHRMGPIIDANPAAATLFGYGQTSAMIGRDLHELYLPEQRRQLDGRTAQLSALSSGESLPLADFELATRDGRRLLVQATGVRIEVDGEPALLSIYLDETAQRQAARAQQRSEALLAQVVSTSPDVITLTDLRSGRYEMANASFCRLTGYAAEEVVGRTALELGLWHHPADRERLLVQLRSQPAVQDVATEFVAKDGRLLPMLISAARFALDGNDYLVVSARDESEANRARLEREAILANASIGIALTRDRRFQLVNPRFEQIYGWPPGELLGQPGRVVWAGDEDYERLGQEIGPALRRGEQVVVERQAMRRDGSVFLARMRAKAIDPTRPGENGTIWIAEDVTHERRAEAELARARDEAEAANRAKSAFLANTSHEIRTPLNGLVGLARLARQPDLEPQRLRQYLDQIGDSAETLSMIISDILDLSKIEAGRLEVEAAPFDLHELLQGLQQAYAALADSHRLDFRFELDPRLPRRVRGDALRLRQILVNYLHNALKFTSAGHIRLSARVLDGQRLRFEVADTGAGIDEATQARLFRPFTQADESTTRRFGGTGLGLSICRELARLMGGSVGLVSRVGEGSRFHAELPLPAVADDAPDDTPGAAAGERLHGARVLVVEDNAVNMMIAVAMLEQWGVEVAQAVDGAQALAAVEQAQARGRPFDAVLMDVQMPGMSGYEATQALRRRYSARELPVVALTAAALVSERERAAAIGMNGFVTKPVDARRLREALLRALAGAGPLSPA